MIKSVFITAYNREKIFFNTLKKLKSCENYKEFKKLIIFQEISKNTLQKIKKVDTKIKVIKTKYKEDASSLYKICYNTYIGFKTCFEKYKSEYVICLEEDILPAYDFLKFHNEIVFKYRGDNKFFAVNSFSRDYDKNLKKKYNIDMNFSYSKFIYGVGKGWTISKEKWPILKKMFKELISFNPNLAFDAYFEPEIKTNYYVIMPYRSRCYEQPSNGLTSRYVDRYNKKWIDSKKSFLNKNNYKIKNYTFLPTMKYSWREDCLNYTTFNIFKTKIKYIKYIIYKFIRNTIGQKKYFIIKNYVKKNST